VKEGAEGAELLLNDLIQIFAFETVEGDDVVDAV